MRIFEFQFNPQASSNRFFRVFSFDQSPEQGSMYIIGELANALPANASLLDRLAQVIRQEYEAPERRTQTPPQRLKSALKKANNFLGGEIKADNVDWIANLHVLVLLFAPAGQDYTFFFTKVGSMHLWMARAGSLVDAGKSVEGAKGEDASPRVFGSMGSGKAVAGDRIIGATQEAFDFFSKENFLQTIAQLSEQKQLNAALNSRRKELSHISGILFFAVVAPLVSSPQLTLPGPSSFLKFPILSLPALPAFSTLRDKLPSFSPRKFSFLMASETKKRMSLIASLLLVLLIGSAIFGDKSGRPTSSERQRPVQAPYEITDEIRAQYRMQDIGKLQVASSLADSSVLREADAMLQIGSRFYFFGTHSPKIFVFDGETNASEIVDAGANPRFGVVMGDSALFFAQPHTLVKVTNRLTVTQHEVEGIRADAQIASVAQFRDHVYLLDARNGEILKMPVPSEGQTFAERWVDPLSPKKPLNALAMAIDGNIWVLNERNEIQRYFRGVWQETLAVDIIPPFRAVTRLKASAQLPYFALLEREQERLVILSKTGTALRQYRSDELARVRDFTVSADGQTIYLFDGEKLYRISPVEY